MDSANAARWPVLISVNFCASLPSILRTSLVRVEPSPRNLLANECARKSTRQQHDSSEEQSPLLSPEDIPFEDYRVMHVPDSGVLFADS